MRGQRSGVLTTRRMEETPACMRCRAMHAIRGDHEILDQFGGAIFLASIDSLNLSVGNDRLRLDAVDVQCAQPLPLFGQDLRRLVLQFQLGREIGRGGNFRRSG